MERTILTVLLLLLAALIGCEKDRDPLSGTVDTNAGTTSKSAEGQGSITLTILNTDGTAIPVHTKVEINALTSEGYMSLPGRTDIHGQVVFDELLSAGWHVDIHHFGYQIATGVDLEEGEQYREILYLPDTINLEIAVTRWPSMNHYPLVDSEIILNPGSMKKLFNTKSMALFENLPFQAYSFEIVRNGVSFSRSLSMYLELPYSSDSVVTGTITFLAISPEIEIEHATTEISYNAYDPPLTLTARATDFFLGELSGQYIQWKSNRDGFLGYGTTCEVEYLSLGTHTITAIVENNEHRTGSDDVILNVYGYSDQSFFQLPDNASWQYAVEPASIIVEDDRGGAETWTFSDWTVITYEPGIFRGNMTCEVHAAETVTEVEYTATESYALEESAILLVMTEERLTLEEQASGTTETIRIVTEYDPPLVVLENHLNPGDTPHRSQTVLGNVTSYYSKHGNSSLNRMEQRLLEITAEIGTPETIDTPSGMIEAIPVTMISDDGSKTVYFSKGIGIAAVESAPFGVPFRTALIESDIEGYTAPVTAARRSGLHGSPAARIALQAGDGPEERLIAYRRILGTLAFNGD